MSKKVNPHRQPRTEADVRKAREQGTNIAAAIFLFVMREKFGWGEKRLTRLWTEIDSFAQDVASGQVKITDIFAVLRDEYGINIMGGRQ